MTKSQDDEQEAQSRADLDESWQRGFDWIEKELGARIVSFERQARWRPAFFLELDRDGQKLEIYLRGERGALDHGAYPLEHESRVLQVLESEGIPVPHVYGFCPDPPAIVMDKSPGRANLATAENEQERVAVLDHYMDLLADLHSIDPKRFEEIGIDRPKGAEALGFCDLDRWEKNYRDSKKRPEPLLEFVTDWLHRNVPRDREEVSCLAVDSGQFVFENGRVTALLDLELACLGDPAADLADSISFNLYTPYTCAPLIVEPPDTVDLVQYLGWYWVWSRACIEIMADGAGLALPTVSIPEPASTAYGSSHKLLVDKLASLRSETDGFLSYELDTAWRNASYLRRVESIWPQMAGEEEAEIDKLLGRSTKPLDREADLEAFVLEHGAAREEELMQFFQKRCLRQEALMGPVMRELVDAKTQLIP